MYAKFVETDGRFAFSEENNGGAEITAEEYAGLMAGQCAGKLITPNVDGKPILVEPPAETPEQFFDACMVAAQELLDSTARSWGYDSLLSATSYAMSSIEKYKTESSLLLAWRDSVWQAGLAIKTTTDGAPNSVADFLVLLPVAPEQPT